MKVFRCDRCGNHYTQEERKNKINIFEIDNGVKYPRNLLCINPCSTEILDLCPDCMTSLINWINYGYFDDGRKFIYEYVEDKEVKEDDNN